MKPIINSDGSIINNPKEIFGEQANFFKKLYTSVIRPDDEIKHLIENSSIPSMASSGKAGSCLPLVGNLQYTTLTNCMYWFPLPFQLPVVI